MLISVVIASLNGSEVLPRCLESLRRTVYEDIEVIVVDNGSTDGTYEVVKESFPEVKVLRSERNLGFAGGNNLGIREARGEIVFLLNDDTEVEPDWARELVQASTSLPDWGVIGAKLLYPDRKTIQHAGGEILPNALTKHIGDGQPDSTEYDSIRKCEYVTGAAFAIRRETLEKVGLLDEGFFPIYFEEVDYCWRVRRAGFQVYYVPSIRIYHYESRTTIKYSSGFFYKYHKNRLRFILKNFNGREILRALKYEAMWLLRHRPFDNLLPLLRAYAVNFYNLPQTLKARRQIRELTTVVGK